MLEPRVLLLGGPGADEIDSCQRGPHGHLPIAAGHRGCAGGSFHSRCGHKFTVCPDLRLNGGRLQVAIEWAHHDSPPSAVGCSASRARIDWRDAILRPAMRKRISTGTDFEKGTSLRT